VPDLHLAYCDTLVVELPLQENSQEFVRFPSYILFTVRLNLADFRYVQQQMISLFLKDSYFEHSLIH
jgi:hypothetical protein